MVVVLFVCVVLGRGVLTS